MQFQQVVREKTLGMSSSIRTEMGWDVTGNIYNLCTNLHSKHEFELHLAFGNAVLTFTISGLKNSQKLSQIEKNPPKPLCSFVCKGSLENRKCLAVNPLFC